MKKLYYLDEDELIYWIESVGKGTLGHRTSPFGDKQEMLERVIDQVVLNVKAILCEAEIDVEDVEDLKGEEK